MSPSKSNGLVFFAIIHFGSREKVVLLENRMALALVPCIKLLRNCTPALYLVLDLRLVEELL